MPNMFFKNDFAKKKFNRKNEYLWKEYKLSNIGREFEIQSNNSREDFKAISNTETQNDAIWRKTIS